MQQKRGDRKMMNCPGEEDPAVEKPKNGLAQRVLVANGATQKNLRVSSSFVGSNIPQSESETFPEDFQFPSEKVLSHISFPDTSQPRTGFKLLKTLSDDQKTPLIHHQLPRNLLPPLHEVIQPCRFSPSSPPGDSWMASFSPFFSCCSPAEHSTLLGCCTTTSVGGVLRSICPVLDFSQRRRTTQQS